jgi:alkylated DNA nucleotide flippase Atl1
MVLSYGEVAARAGLKSARLVGRILAESHGLPWHRVIRADGTATPHLAVRQTALLRAEGVRLVERGAARASVATKAASRTSGGRTARR